MRNLLFMALMLCFSIVSIGQVNITYDDTGVMSSTEYSSSAPLNKWHLIHYVTADGLTITLPSSPRLYQTFYIIADFPSGTVNFNTSGKDVNGSTTFTMVAGETVALNYDGTEWRTIGSNGVGGAPLTEIPVSPSLELVGTVPSGTSVDDGRTLHVIDVDATIIKTPETPSNGDIHSFYMNVIGGSATIQPNTAQTIVDGTPNLTLEGGEIIALQWDDVNNNWVTLFPTPIPPMDTLNNSLSNFQNFTPTEDGDTIIDGTRLVYILGTAEVFLPQNPVDGQEHVVLGLGFGSEMIVNSGATPFFTGTTTLPIRDGAIVTFNYNPALGAWFFDYNMFTNVVPTQAPKETIRYSHMILGFNDTFYLPENPFIGETYKLVLGNGVNEAVIETNDKTILFWSDSLSSIDEDTSVTLKRGFKDEITLIFYSGEDEWLEIAPIDKVKNVKKINYLQSAISVSGYAADEAIHFFENTSAAEITVRLEGDVFNVDGRTVKIVSPKESSSTVLVRSNEVSTTVDGVVGYVLYPDNWVELSYDAENDNFVVVGESKANKYKTTNFVTTAINLELYGAEEDIHIIANTNGANITVDMLSAIFAKNGRTTRFVTPSGASHNVVLDPQGATTINGTATYSMAASKFVLLYYDVTTDDFIILSSGSN